MEAKPWYQSKTVWFNIITTTLAILSLTQFGDIIPPSFAKYVAFLNAAGNVILRIFFTEGAVTGTQSAANMKNASLAMLVGVAGLMTVGCGGNPKPVLSPIAQTAATGSKLVQANDLALTGIDALTDQGVVPKDAMKAIIRGSDYVAKGSKSLVVALRSCTSTPANCADVQSAIAAIRSGLNDGLRLIPEGPAKDQVKAILQPVFDLLLEIFAPPPQAHALSPSRLQFVAVS
jgi:hypothetical protein